MESPSTDLFQVLAVVSAMGVTLFSVFVTLSEGRRRKQRMAANRAAQPLDQKLQRIMDLSTELSDLNQEAKADFELQLAATKQAQLQAENAAALAALSEEQRRAAADLVAARVDEAFDSRTKSDRRFQVLIAMSSYLAGIVSTVIVGLLMR